jgi:hypothetical protein
MAILELVALAVIAGLLYQLLKEARLLRRRMEAGREKKDGQTINVNVAPVAVPEGKSPPPTPKEPEPEPKSEDGEPEDPPVASPPPPNPSAPWGR